MEKISSEDIYNLGLLYVYLFSNKEKKSLPLDNLEKFKQVIEKKLIESNFSFSSNASIDDQLREKISFSFQNEEKEYYSLKKDFNLEMAKSFYIDKLPTSIILSSKLPDALDCLGLIWINDEIKSIDRLKLLKKENECCQNCEYAISDELLESIMEENSEYQKISLKQLREQLGYCEINSTSYIADKLEFWCPNYLSNEEIEKNLVLKKENRFPH